MTGYLTTRCLWILTLLALLNLGGCAFWKQNRENLEETAYEYHRMIRWQETDGLSYYVAEALRPVYREKKGTFDAVRVIDFKIKQVEMTPDREKATVTVEYQYHHKSEARIKTMTDTQKWEFYPTGNPSGWRIISLPPTFP